VHNSILELGLSTQNLQVGIGKDIEEECGQKHKQCVKLNLISPPSSICRSEIEHDLIEMTQKIESCTILDIVV
jgi:hypothetical protein